MRMRIGTLLSFMCLLGATTFVHADFIAIDDPYAVMPNAKPYLTGTSLVSIGGAPNSSPSFSGGLTLGLSGPTQIFLTGPLGWGMWGSPPNAETSTPTILYSNGATALTLSFGQHLSAFGLEADSGYYGNHPITATFFSGSDVVGTITRDIVDTPSFAGSLLFAAYTNDVNGFTSVEISSNVDFGIAQIRFAPVTLVANAPKTPDVPEPSTCVLALTFLGCTSGSYLWNRRRKKTPS